MPQGRTLRSGPRASARETVQYRFEPLRDQAEPASVPMASGPLQDG